MYNEGIFFNYLVGKKYLKLGIVLNVIFFFIVMKLQKQKNKKNIQNV